ncbi:hypothetical protein LXL04_037674 [Taraxacum kok-saghyz]
MSGQSDARGSTFSAFKFSAEYDTIRIVPNLRMERLRRFWFLSATISLESSNMASYRFEEEREMHDSTSRLDIFWVGGFVQNRHWFHISNIRTYAMKTFVNNASDALDRPSLLGDADVARTYNFGNGMSFGDAFVEVYRCYSNARGIKNDPFLAIMSFIYG